MTDFSFEDFIESWNENDKFMRLFSYAHSCIGRLMEFFVKETAMRHYSKEQGTVEQEPSHRDYGNLVALALDVSDPLTNRNASGVDMTRSFHQGIHNSFRSLQNNPTVSRDARNLLSAGDFFLIFISR